MSLTKAAATYFDEHRETVKEELTQEDKERIAELAQERENLDGQFEEMFSRLTSEGLGAAAVMRNEEALTILQRQDEITNEMQEGEPSASEILCAVLAKVVGDLNENGEYPVATYSVSITDTGVEYKVSKMRANSRGSFTITADNEEIASAGMAKELPPVLMEKYPSIFTEARHAYADRVYYVTKGDGTESERITQKTSVRDCELAKMMVSLMNANKHKHMVLWRGERICLEVNHTEEGPKVEVK